MVRFGVLMFLVVISARVEAQLWFCGDTALIEVDTSDEDLFPAAEYIVYSSRPQFYQNRTGLTLYNISDNGSILFDTSGYCLIANINDLRFLVDVQNSWAAYSSDRSKDQEPRIVIGILGPGYNANYNEPDSASFR